jgi:cell division protein FtsB
MAEGVEGEPTLGQLKSLTEEVHANTANECEDSGMWILSSILLAIIVAACVYVIRLEYRAHNDRLKEDKERLEKRYNELEKRNEKLMEENRAEYNHLSKQVDKLREKKWELMGRYQDARRLLV